MRRLREGGAAFLIQCGSWLQRKLKALSPVFWWVNDELSKISRSSAIQGFVSDRQPIKKGQNRS